MIFVNKKFLKVLSNPRANMKYEHEKFRGSDPDPYWIQIQSGQWIRIRIRNPDPDLGGHKLPTKKKKNNEISCFEELDVLFL